MRRRLLEYALLLTGLVFVFIFGNSYLKFQHFQQKSFALPRPSTKVSQIERDPHPVIGQLSIRRLGFSVSMVEGDDEESLELAAGHMPGTAMAGHSGNMIIAGHRDSAFWPLRNIRAGDRIEVQTGSKAVYRVQTMHVIDPDDVKDLGDTEDAVLTLVTCYPFHHVGPAPKRFVVRAKLAP